MPVPLGAVTSRPPPRPSPPLRGGRGCGRRDVPSPRLRRGGVGGGGSIRVQRCIDCRENAGHVFKDVVIPETQHAIAVGFKILRAHLIRGTIGMLTAVELDNESRFVTGKVSEIRTDGRLTAKMMGLEWRLSQMLPELLLSFGRVATQGARARHAGVNSTLRHLPHHPPPTPPRHALRARREGSGMRARPLVIPNHVHRDASAPALPASVCTQASPQALASSRTRRI